MTDTIPTPGTTGQHTDAPTQDDLDRARDLTVGDTPTIQASVEPFVELPRGLYHAGTWQRRAMVRELTGVDEEAVSRVKDITDIYDTVLALGTVRIGELELGALPLTERQGHLSQLLLGERDLLFIAVVRAAYGDQKKLLYTCQSCQEKQQLTVVLSEDFPVQTVDDIERTEFEFTTSKGERVVYRPAIGADQMEALKRKNATLAEQNTIMLARCIKEVNGQMVLDSTAYARNLPLRDRTALLGDLVSRQPTVNMTVTVDCVACREEQVIPLGWADLFQP